MSASLPRSGPGGCDTRRDSTSAGITTRGRGVPPRRWTRPLAAGSWETASAVSTGTESSLNVEPSCAAESEEQHCPASTAAQA